MTRTYVCYVYGAGGSAPALHILNCPLEGDLLADVTAQISGWGEFEKVEIYDIDKRLITTFQARP